MNVHFRSSASKRLVQRLHVLFRIGADRPTLHDFFYWQFGFSALLNFLRIPNIEIWLPRLWTKAPQLRRFLRIFLASDHHILFKKNRHLGSILSTFSRSIFKFFTMLLPSLGIGN